MQTSRKFFNALLAAAALVVMSASAFGADPGLAVSGDVGSQRPESRLSARL